MIGDKLITLGHQVSGKKLQLFKNGNITLRPKTITLNGRAGWDTKLTPKKLGTLTPIVPGEGEAAKDEGTRKDVAKKIVPLPTCFTCPSCQAPLLSTNRISSSRTQTNLPSARAAALAAK